MKAIASTHWERGRLASNERAARTLGATFRGERECGRDARAPSRQVRRTAQFSVVLLAALALKQHYSTASVNELRWILAPTTFLVELVTGSRFEFESYAGYMNSDRTFVIAGSCAGVNFLIAAFVMLSLKLLWRSRAEETSWSFLLITAVAAYATTLIANTVRISTALRFHRDPLELSWLSGNQLHRFEGIFIYFGFLLLLFLLSEKWSSSAKSSTTVAGGLAFPLLVYYATTLAVPLLNIASGRESAAAALGEHLLFVLVTPLFLVLPLLAMSFIRRPRIE